MSSAEDESDPMLTQGRRKKRRMRACDMCRRRKVRCDGGQMPNNICTNCITFKYKCTYVQSAPKRLPDAGYIECLETQMAEMRTLLNKYRQICPDVELAEDLNRISTSSSPFPERSSATSSPRPSAATPTLPVTGPQMTMSSISPAPSADTKDKEPDFDPSDDEITARNTLAQSFEDLDLHPTQDHFLGKSSSMMFLQAALDIKQEYVVGGLAGKRNFPSLSQPVLESASQWTPSQSTENSKGKEKEGATGSGNVPTELLFPFRLKRPEFWLEPPWVMNEMEEQHSFEYPPQDLLDMLVGNYFDWFNIYTPLLHRPTFEHHVHEQLHLRDSGFGAVLLMVCALASRSCDDPRVLLPEERVRWADKEAGERTYHSAGWEWFVQVQKSKLVMSFVPPRLYDLQITYLVAIYIWGTSSSEISWQCVGYGLRMAQLMGAHRKKAYQAQPNVDEELRKRAFWALLLLDRTHSSVLGRPCALQDEDFDVDLPLTCDDEYWEHTDPDQNFKQPEGKPSRNIFFSYHLRLMQIHAFALRTIYSINKSKALLGLVGQDWQQRVVAEIDSALNGWIDSIPEYLRWDPHMKNSVFVNQSALLYSSYYTIQITVHRPFIPSPRKPSLLSFPSLAICTNAARSCIHVLDEEWKKTGSTSHFHQLFGLFSSGVVLLLSIWGGKRSGLSTDPAKEMQEVHKAMYLLKILEPRWYAAGRIWDILYDLANVGDLPLPQRTPSTHKRPHRSSEPTHQPQQHQSQIRTERHIVGSRRVEQFQQQSSASAADPAQDGSAYSLPLYSQELASLPIHPSTASSGPLTNTATPMSTWDTDFDAAHRFSTSVPSSRRPLPRGDSMMRPPIDPAFEALVTMLAPAQYQQPTLPHQSTLTPNIPRTVSQDFPGFAHNQALNTMVQNMNSADRGGFNHLAPDSQALDADTLAMWSTAPSNFSWEDWGTYVTGFSGPPATPFSGQ